MGILAMMGYGIIILETRIWGNRWTRLDRVHLPMSSGIVEAVRRSMIDGIR